MNCSRIQGTLLLHAHDQLGAVPRLRVDYHLARCPACRARRAGWAREGSQWRRALAEEPTLNGSAGRLRAAVGERIRREPRPAPPARTMARALPAQPRALALVLLAVVI